MPDGFRTSSKHDFLQEENENIRGNEILNRQLDYPANARTNIFTKQSLAEP